MLRSRPRCIPGTADTPSRRQRRCGRRAAATKWPGRVALGRLGASSGGARSDSSIDPADPDIVVLSPSGHGECPFPSELLAERFGLEGMPLTPAEAGRCRIAGTLTSSRTMDELTVVCAGAASRNAGRVRPAYRILDRSHAELQVGAHRVHIEAVEQELDGPGGINREVRVYVDGVLEGRGVLLGRLGATVNTFPLAAAIGAEAIMVVTPCRWTSMRMLHVQLQKAHSNVL